MAGSSVSDNVIAGWSNIHRRRPCVNLDFLLLLLNRSSGLIGSLKHGSHTREALSDGGRMRFLISLEILNLGLCFAKPTGHGVKIGLLPVFGEAQGTEVGFK